MNAPDFAFPKDVAKNAETDLKNALKLDDAHAALNALVRMYVANEIIDADSRRESIEKITSVADKFADDPLSGIFDALLARLYFDYYQDRRWSYDRRRLPLTPLPKQLSEWSGDQFKNKIRQLCEKSIANPAVLRSLRLSDYADIVTCDKASSPYFPTLLDFAYQNTLNLSNRTDNFLTDAEIAEIALRNVGSTGAQYYWQYVLTKATDNKPAAWTALTQKNISDPLASIFLIGGYESLSSARPWRRAGGEPRFSGEQDKASLYNQLTLFTNKHPGCPFAQNLKYFMQSLAQKHITVETPAMCASGTTVTAKISNSNATSYDVAVYRLTDKQGRNGGIETKRLKTLQPVSVTHHDCNKTVPFTTETTISLTLPTPGYYAVVPVIDGNLSDDWISAIRCIPVLPIALSNVSPSKILAVDPHTGAPMQGIGVTLKNDKITRKLAPTDAMGMTNADPSILAKQRYWHVGLSYQNSTYDFDQVSIHGLNAPRADSTSTARILTDRAIYHAGDEINWLVVAYDSKITKDNDISASLSTGCSISVVLCDANYQPVDTITAKTDGLGRAYGKFTTPTEGLTGQFSIKVFSNAAKFRKLGQQYITVADYKMPDFELTDIKTQRNVDGDSTVTITGRAMSYSGMPMPQTTVTTIVSKASWWRWFSPSEQVYSAEATTDADGKFSLTMTGAQLQADNESPFFIADLSASSMSGSTAKASTTFSMGPQYLIDIENPGNVDALKPFIPAISVVSADGEKATIDLLWEIKTDSVIVMKGKVASPIDLSSLAPGIYSFVVKSSNPTLANEASVQMSVYNVNTDIVPSLKPLWLCNDSGSVTADSNGNIELLAGTTARQTSMFYFITDSKSGTLVKFDRLDLPKGYHHLKLPVCSDSENLQMTLLCVKDCNTYTETLSVGRNTTQSIKIVGESFRDRLLPASAETWRLRLTNQDGSPVKGALALDMYNKALEAIMPHSFQLSLAPTFYSRNFFSVNYAYNSDISNDYVWRITGDYGQGLTPPQFQLYQSGYGRVEDYVMYKSAAPTAMKMARAEYAAADGVANDMILEEAEEEAADEVANESPVGGADRGGSEPDTFDYRDSNVPLAIWAPTLTSDDDGNIVFSFTVPNANTTWRLRAVAWNRDMLTGSMMRDFVASKPVMVQPNAPRFLRAGDCARILANVMNNTDSVAAISTTIELLNPATGQVFSSSASTDTISPKGSAIVSIMVEAPTDAAAICYRVRSSNGDFSDGEQSAIRILPSQSQLIETTPFYLNPGDTTYVTTLPSVPGARLSLTFSENPAWAIVSALPGLRQDIGSTANSAAAALLSAAVSRGLTQSNPAIADAVKHWIDNPSDSVLVSMLEKNEDLKLALLNSTPWVQAAQSDTERMANLALIFSDKDINRSIDQAIKQLKKLQNADGGWNWGSWCNQSSYWVTGNVLETLGYLKSLGWLPKEKSLRDMIAKAVRYYDENVYVKKASPDMLYCLIRAYYKDIPLGLKGERTIAVTTSDILKHWKSYANPTQKAMAAMTLHQYKYPTKARQLMTSLDQFGVWTPQQGLKYPSVNSLADYAIILSAYAMIQPDNKAVDGLRQQLIVRKQGTDWGSAVVSSQVIVSILQSGSTWTVPSKGATITVGGKAVKPASPVEHATGTLRANLSQYAGQQLTIATPGTGPAYGAVFAQFSQTMHSIKPVACDDLSIEKSIAVRRGNDWVYAPDSVAVGDRVQIVLTIHCKRNLDYVTIIDERAATFEPVDQVPGWLYSDGVGFYRENRDSFTGLYVDYMQPGTYQLTYEMDVTVAGTFSSGVAAIQSQYAPELSAHSAGATLHVD